VPMRISSLAGWDRVIRSSEALSSGLTFLASCGRD